jgi:hypothetical protein
MRDRHTSTERFARLHAKYPLAAEFVAGLSSAEASPFKRLLADSTFADNFAVLGKKLDLSISRDQVEGNVSGFETYVYKMLAYFSLAQELFARNQTVLSPFRIRDIVEEKTRRRRIEGPFGYGLAGIKLADGLIMESGDNAQNHFKAACVYCSRENLNGEYLFKIRKIAEYAKSGSTLGPVESNFEIFVVMLAKGDAIDAAKKRIDVMGVASSVQSAPFTRIAFDDFVSRVVLDTAPRPNTI